MREIQIDLTLQFKMPESGLNVNGVLMGLRHANARVSFALLGALLSAIEEQTIEGNSGDTILNYFSSLFLHGSFGPVFLDKQEKAILTVLEQAELPCKDWAD